MTDVATRRAEKLALVAAHLNETKKGSIVGQVVLEPHPVFSTGNFRIDHELCGIGGLPQGRIIEVYGWESCGKTTFALMVAAEVQRAGGVVGFLDAENAIDTHFAKDKVGVDLNSLVLYQCDSAEDGLNVVEGWVKSGGFDMVIVDSVAALVPQAEVDGEMGDSHMGLHARLMSQALRKITPWAKKTNTTVLFINQLRNGIGPYAGGPKPTGGNALKFYATMRFQITRKDKKIEGSKEDGIVTGFDCQIEVIKNKMAPPFRKAIIPFNFEVGFDNVATLLLMAEECKDSEFVLKSGAWWSAFGERLGQGFANAVGFLRENPEVLKRILHYLGEVWQVRGLMGADLSGTPAEVEVEITEPPKKRGRPKKEKVV